ncbi:MAG: hypothetical protein ABH879_07160 [archaeon]
MEKDAVKGTITALLGVFVLGAVLSAITFNGPYAYGANVTNDSVVTRVNVWNTEPNITGITIIPDPINLEPGNLTTVTCSVAFFDRNGWRDVTDGGVNATFYAYPAMKSNSADDENHHYTNGSCTGNCSGSGNTGSCDCKFKVEYFANASTWICNATIIDDGGNATTRFFNLSDSKNKSTTISRLIAIDVPSELDYGNLSVTEISGQKIVNITNLGNTHINVSVRGYGGTGTEVAGENRSMICAFNDIPVGMQRYSLENNTQYESMTNVSNSNAVFYPFTLWQRINNNQREFGRDFNFTYWRLKIPLTVGGSCNGSLVFSAVEK